MNRFLLSEKLHEFCDNVYYQPPAGFQLKYPCIIYERRTGDSLYADDSPYKFDYCYTVTYIDPDPDSVIPLKLSMLPMCKMDRCFTSDNLNHSVFILYYHIAPADKIYDNKFGIEVPHMGWSKTYAEKYDSMVYLRARIEPSGTFYNKTTLLFMLPSELIPIGYRSFPCELSFTINPDIHGTGTINVLGSGKVMLELKSIYGPYDYVAFDHVYSIKKEN